MNAAFLGLAGLAALNPQLLIIDLLLATNRRPRPMFLCFLLGGMGLGITVGLVDVFVLHLDAIKTQNHASGGLDLALGIPLLIAGALLATNHLHLRRRRPHPMPQQKPPSKLESWAVRVSSKLDASRMLVTEKVFGFLLAALGVQLVLNGLSDVGVIHLTTGH